MPATRINTRTLHKMVLRLLQAGLDGQGITALSMKDPVPDTSADTTGDTPTSRWCRIANIQTTRLGRRENSIDGGYRSVAVTVTVGVSAALQQSDPTRIENDADLVAAALDGASDTVDDHRLDLYEADANPAPADDAHPGHRLYVVTAIGRVQNV